MCFQEYFEEMCVNSGYIVLTDEDFKPVNWVSTKDSPYIGKIRANFKYIMMKGESD